MKYILLCTVAFIICFTLGLIITSLLKKKKLNNLTKLASVILSTGIGIVLIVLVSFVYLNSYYHVDSKALEKVYSNTNVRVERIKNGYFIDGPGRTSALVFYPGAKVEALSYAPLLSKIAESGIDCFLADMPFNMAIFNMDVANEFIENYLYDEWIGMGHSMGGIAISNYSNKYPNKLNCLVLLASYPNKKIDESIKFYSVYGNNDGCLDRNEYDKNKKNWPSNSNELVIDGGNHAQFGNYGIQTSDGEAKISADLQQQVIVDLLLNMENK